jgi:flagellar biosynthesis protein FliR
VEYVLIVSFALLIGFCLGVLVMMLLESPDAAGSAGKSRLRVREVSPSRR